ncbi:MAG: type II secretion system protein [Candidatus Nealsonbacteria bacterium]|nr:type II secretion system protein [Candidatus Nealsonbacteria bacterium]
MRKGFTLIELLVVTSIIILFTALLTPNYREGAKQLAIQGAASKLAQDFRRAQEMALSSQEFQGRVPAGYGLYFRDNEPGRYFLFADLDGDKQYSIGDAVVEDIALERSAQISGLSASPSLSIVFTSPEPIVTITPLAGTATINLGRQERKYLYEFIENVSSHLAPRASCDVASSIKECSFSFSASAGDPTIIYDQYNQASMGYSYQWQQNLAGALSPRASCDAQSSQKECPSSFSASAGDPSTAYDRYQESLTQHVRISTNFGAWSNPRATHCDIDWNQKECGQSFLDQYGYPEYVFDWWKSDGRAMSEKYQRQATPQDYSQQYSKVSFSQTDEYSSKYQKREITSAISAVTINSVGLVEIY